MLLKRIQEKREAELKRQKQDTVKKVGVALVIGSFVSAVVTLFTAPKSGKELRQDVVEKVEEGTELVKDGATKAAKKTTEIVNDAISKGQDIKEKVKLKVNTMTQPADETPIDKIEEAVEEMVEDIKETFEG
ncbi:MAG TPA: hypothetical protein DCS67_06420 [Clostridiales bacterium UBA8960]|jgi:gas vesicle protein|nr:hypothetical protein [Clostridiales bacterium UBA8960]